MSLAHVTQSSSRGLLPNRESKHALQLVSPSVALVRRFLCWSDCRWPFLVLSKQHRRALPLSTHPSSRQSMVRCPCPLCPQLVSQTPQHFRSSETQATCGGRFARHFICWVFFFFFFFCTPAHPQNKISCESKMRYLHIYIVLHYIVRLGRDWAGTPAPLHSRHQCNSST